MLTLKPCSLKQANDFVTKHHRHHRAAAFHKFSVSLLNESGEIVGVGIAGRPKNKYVDDDNTIEIVRCCTDGTINSCSMIYGALCRAAKALGYTRAITYKLQSEKGSSMLASGFKFNGNFTPSGGWRRKGRDKEYDGNLEPKSRWIKLL